MVLTDSDDDDDYIRPLKKQKKTPRWSEYEVQLLKTMIKKHNISTRNDKHWKKITGQIARSKQACICKARNLGLIK